ncbi:MAG: PqiC family protein [Pseudomonas sp.]|uniref:PqiC family protein n=1 Tax=Pseudomonas abieticivorans TaxID=2931382 RepID=UPI0020C0B4B4|nr:PqiC family protein [Pseudomonas sp. PIA16]MDE1169486.1 PqiC family protein [Pseudomonas sp.]
MNLRTLALAAPLLLTACSSVPTHYYTLVPTAPQTQAQVTPAPFQFQLLSVRMPVQADQPQLVVRESTGQLAILENERWSAPLADEFNDALATQLEQQLGTRDLSSLPKDTSRPLLTLQADVRRFDSIPGNYALIDVVWNLSQRDEGQKRRSLTCSTQLRQQAGTDLASVVQAHQQLIGKLAKTIAGTARAWSAQPSTGCP